VAETTSISWADATFNVVWGCTKVSPGCTHCYAESFAARFGTGWGPAATRRTFGDHHWNEPVRWDRKARAAGRRLKVFCGSMCDVAEDHPAVKATLPRLFEMIRRTRNLDWLLTTKRPERLAEIIELLDCGPFPFPALYPNVWAVVTTEDQEWLERRLPAIDRLSRRCVVTALSVEPQLGHVSIPAACRKAGLSFGPSLINWVICGGESAQPGTEARPFDVLWAAHLLGQCQGAGVAFHLKQLGSNPTHNGAPLALADPKGKDPAEWSATLRVQEFPTPRTFPGIDADDDSPEHPAGG
jgi:protein gp37